MKAKFLRFWRKQNQIALCISFLDHRQNTRIHHPLKFYFKIWDHYLTFWEDPDKRSIFSYWERAGTKPCAQFFFCLNVRWLFYELLLMLLILWRNSKSFSEIISVKMGKNYGGILEKLWKNFLKNISIKHCKIFEVMFWRIYEKLYRNFK